MTAAIAHLTGPGLRSSLRGRWARVFSALAIVLPVPLLAALGLSLPLPSSVERLAAKLVPFGDADALDANGTQALARGAIVHARGEQDAGGRVASTASDGSVVPFLPVSAAGKGATHDGALPTVTEPRGETSEGSRDNGAGADASAAASGTKQSGDDSGPAPTTGGGSITSPGGTQTAPDPDPETSPVETATNTANGTVGSATNTVTTATGSATGTATAAADSAGGTVSDTVGGINPP
jgi:hypothetical protein